MHGIVPRQRIIARFLRRGKINQTFQTREERTMGFRRMRNNGFITRRGWRGNVRVRFVECRRVDRNGIGRCARIGMTVQWKNFRDELHWTWLHRTDRIQMMLNGTVNRRGFTKVKGVRRRMPRRSNKPLRLTCQRHRRHRATVSNCTNQNLYSQHWHNFEPFRVETQFDNASYESK